MGRLAFWNGYDVLPTHSAIDSAKMKQLYLERGKYYPLARHMSTITVTVKLFAAYQEAYGLSEITFNFPYAIPVRDVLEKILQEHPELEKWRNVTRFGVNLQFVEPETLVQDGDEVVLIPPVSGG